MLWRNSHPFRVQHNPQRRHHWLEIQQRLALPHQHDIGLYFAGGLCSAGLWTLRADFISRRSGLQPRHKLRPSNSGFSP